MGAFVAALGDESPLVKRIVRRTGVAATLGEFKSGARMAGNVALQQTRSLLGSLLAKRCRILITAVPYDQRETLGAVGLALLRQALNSGVVPDGDHVAYFDEGIVVPGTVDDPVLSTVLIHREQDSKMVGGLQLADLAAHTLSMILLQNLGEAKKILEGAGPEWGYDDDAEIDLAFALWAPLRNNFLSGGLPPIDQIRTNEDMMVTVEGFGLLVPQVCADLLATALRSSFGSSYLGCMH